VGEAMAIGRTFIEAFQKTLRSLEQGRFGLGADGKDDLNVRELPENSKPEWRKKILDRLKIPKPENVFYLRYALQLVHRWMRFTKSPRSTPGSCTI
jgi:carbamoyl-phosphate synthase large subunit